MAHQLTGKLTLDNEELLKEWPALQKANPALANVLWFAVRKESEFAAGLKTPAGNVEAVLDIEPVTVGEQAG